jgi:aminotransferase
LPFSSRLAQVRQSGIRRIFDRSEGVKGLINLGIGEPDFEVPGFVREALKKAVDSGFSHYTSNRGLPELRTEIASKLRRENGVNADPRKEIIVTAGATQAIFVLMNSLLNEGDEVVIPSPAFTAYWAAVKLAGGKPVEVPMNEGDGYRLDSKKLAKAYTARTRLLVLNSPGNPTGIVYSRKDVKEACQSATRRGLYILSDEVYEKFLYDGATHFSPASLDEFRERVVTVGGLSKTFAIPGWRLGYAMASEKVIDKMTRYNMYNAVCASSIVQVAGISALRGPQRFFKPVLKEFGKRRKMVCNSLRELGMKFVTPRGAFYVFPRIGGNRANSMSFSERFLSRHKVATIPGKSFGRGGESHIRISYSVSEDKLITAMNRLRDFRREMKMD